MPLTCDPLLRVLRNPTDSAQLNLSQWDLLLRQARRANLLSALSERFLHADLVDSVPPKVRKYLDAANMLADANRRGARWEVRCVLKALEGTGIPVVLLKGAAYVLADVPTGRGRLFHDIDFMVPKARLEQVEQALRWQGWTSTHLNPYDQRYYRQWMHELPPMRHVKRGTVLDVHHTILPETAKLHPDPEKLLSAARDVPGFPMLKVFAPADMVLHSATHLFHDGELENGLRDLVDLDSLLRHFGDKPRFWDDLNHRAAELDLTRPLYYALRFTRELLNTPVPEAAWRQAQQGRPPVLLASLMNALFRRALLPDHDSCNTWLTAPARWLLYVRSHHLRMPLHLLVPHLVRKALRGKVDTEKP
ncbi:MAG: nucleotidyltransferase family protein [Gammaproteobacteria bacterium]|nr:nucleotidyltransferase family protein [Gammaproteobacteria bacterium]